MNELAPPSPIPSLEAVIDELATFGQPRAYMHRDRTWTVSVEMTTTTAGAEFIVRSGCNHSSVMVAAVECLERARSALRSGGHAVQSR